MNNVIQGSFSYLTLLQYYFDRSLSRRYNNKTIEKDQLVLLFSFALLAAGAIIYLLDGLHTGFYFAHNLGHALMPDFMWANITFLGDTHAALAIALVVSMRYPRLVIAVFISAIVGTLIIHGLKHFFAAARPPAVIEAHLISIIGPAFSKNSFPSGHTATAFILAGIVCRCVPSTKAKLAVLLCAVFIGWSRVVCGVHWPVDVFAGAGLGLFSAWLGLRLSDRIKPNIWWVYGLRAILVLAAVLLFDVDAGFTSTFWLAKFLSVSALVYWFLFEVNYWRSERGLRISVYRGLDHLMAGFKIRNS